MDSLDGFEILMASLRGMAVGICILLFLRGMMRMPTQWNRCVILRLGRFHRVAGPGIFFKIPLIDKVTQKISIQINATEVKAEKTLTKDTVPVTVKTVMFWRVLDPAAAVIDVNDYQASLVLAAQTSLREAIGSHDFTDLLCNRTSVDAALLTAIDSKAKRWGLEVQSVEIQDIQIPSDLQASMSREAQAEREKHARVILGESEIQIAQKFAEAAKVYEDSPTALQLRAMNIIYETTKERGSTIIVPSQLMDAFAGKLIKG